MLLTDDGALCGVGCFTVATLERPARTNRASIERALQTHDLTELMDAERDCRSTSVKLRNAIAQIMFTQLIERAPVDLDRLLYIDKTAVLAGYECSNLARGLLLAGIQRAKRLNIRYLSILATAAAPHHISESVSVRANGGGDECRVQNLDCKSKSIFAYLFIFSLAPLVLHVSNTREFAIVANRSSPRAAVWLMAAVAQRSTLAPSIGSRHQRDCN